MTLMLDGTQDSRAHRKHATSRHLQLCGMHSLGGRLDIPSRHLQCCRPDGSGGHDSRTECLRVSSVSERRCQAMSASARNSLHTCSMQCIL